MSCALGAAQESWPAGSLAERTWRISFPVLGRSSENLEPWASEKASGGGCVYTGQELESKKTDGGTADKDLHGEPTRKDSKRDTRLQRTTKGPVGAGYSIFRRVV